AETRDVISKDTKETKETRDTKDTKDVSRRRDMWNALRVLGPRSVAGRATVSVCPFPLCTLWVLCVLCVLPVFGQEPAAPQAVSPAQLKAAIDKLGDLDYTTRTNAARTVRRTSPSQAVPALLQAVGEHTDGYVRYRALVLLTGFNDPRTKDAM